MLSSTTAATHLLVSPYSFPNFTPHAFPSILYVVNSRTARRQQRLKAMSFVSVRESGCSLCLGFSEFKKGACSGFVRRCKDWDREGDFTLETEILEFMKSSKKPGAFPSKKELLESGREDLVDAIARKGGWLSLGWDLEEEEGAQDSNFRQWDSIVAKEGESSASSGSLIGASGMVSSFFDDSSQAASSSGRSLEAATTEDDTGIEGILNRLEKQRNLTFGFNLKEKEDDVFFPSTYKFPEISTDATVAGLIRSSRPASLNPKKAILNDSRDKPNHNRSLSDIDVLAESPRPEMWRTWSIQRAGFSDQGFEAAEISYDKMRGPEDVSREEIFQLREGVNEPDQGNKLNSHQEEISHKQIRDHIKYLESELSSALRSLRNRSDEAASQENEIMHAQDKLRSTRAKLAVLEGKMALAIIAAQKTVEEKQRRINDARRAVQLLRTAYIVWPNSASEVLIAGSYDGWTTQRKMEKSSTGIFSLCLRLYPGRYEIKFIVDGEWRIDPLRPIVHNSGYENNVLIIT
ncbi:protein PTST homolog 2, chloroplastic isoform X2 [Prunus dulcis]|uniref:protein PTST homolog 2, chloroplastic isoform X2 n=1 Tax=Prunus dulcis TaxID=3755 RepID=UPI001483523E|nr:protein PTST homolog 2, chloroplastic isoform X2 [Prunus dulcis]